MGAGKMAVVISSGVATAAVAVATVAVVSNLNSTPEEPEEQRSVVVTQENIQEILEAEEEESEDTGMTSPGYYTVTMTSDWHFPDGTSTSADAYVKNSDQNVTDVYFDLFMSDDEENVIYKSPIIPLGAELKDIKLDKDLDAGIYNCICEYHLVDGNQRTLDTLRVRVTVTVEQ